MANGGSFTLGAAAGGVSDALTELLTRARLEQLQNAALDQRRRQFERQLAQDAEGARRFDLSHELAERNAASLEASRAAEAARDRAAADKDAKRISGIQAVVDDPNLPDPLRNLLRLNALGVANVNIHDVEGPEAHAAHVQKENQLKADNAFADFTRRADYTEQLRRNRPVRMAGARLAPGQDDPELPRGTQLYLTEIRRKHDTFDHALAELQAYLADPETQRIHPGLSPQRAVTALRQFYTGAAQPPDAADGTDERNVERLVDRVLGGAGGGQASTYRWSDGTTRAYPEPGAQSGSESVRGLAPVRSETELRERASAALQQRLGRPATSQEVDTLLNNPRNRQLLGGQ